MGSVASVNPGISSLLQTISNSGSSALASELSSPTVESALQNAPSGDIVQLTDQALQLQAVNGLFGSPTQSTDPTSLLSSLFQPVTSTPSNGANSLLQSLEASAPASTGTDSSSADTNAATQQATLNDQLALYQTALQSQQVEGLFGAGTTDPSINLLA